MKSSSRARQWRTTSAAVTWAPARSVTTARTASPSTVSLTPYTAASATAGSAYRTSSTSRGLTFSPRVLMMSSLRPTK